jgi:hypothetical protein
MNAYWNNPPDDQEPPEWYMTLEDVLDQQDPPQTVADAIRKAMEEWVQEHNAQHDIDPPDDPKLIEGDYLKDQHDDREESAEDYDYEADDRAFDAAKASR